MNDIKRSMIAVTLGIIYITITIACSLPLPGAMLSLLIIHMAFLYGRNAGLITSIFILIAEVAYYHKDGYTSEELYRLGVFALAQPMMAIIVGSLKHQYDQLQNELVIKLTHHADTYRRYFDALMQSLPMIANYPAISFINKDGNYIIANEEFAYLCGYTEDEVIGKKWYISIDPADLDKAQLIYEEMIKTGHSSPVRYRGINKDGKSFEKEVMLLMCRDKEGRFLGHIKLERKI